jgi:maltose/moltooligosaccharide transporter
MSAPTPSATSAANATQTAPVERDAAGRRLWRAGTLTYTTAGLVVLFAWLLWGDFAWNMKDRAITPVGQLMLRQFGASDFLVSLLVGSVPAAIGLILGPVISVRSDRHRGRWGRRIPYLLIPTPIIAFTLVGLAYTVPVGDWLHGFLGANSPGELGCRLIAFSFFWAAFEVFQTIAQAVFGGLINDVVPQEVIGRFFGLFRIVSLFAAIIFNFKLIGIAETHSKEIFLGLGLLFGVGFMLMCLMVKEGDYPPPAPLAPDAKGALQTAFANTSGYLRECFSNRYYLWLFAAGMLGGLASAPVNTFSVFYAKSMNINMTDYGHLLVITYCFSIVSAYFIGWAADKFHPVRLGIISLAVYATAMLWGGWAATDARTFSIIFVLHGVIQGVYNTGIASLGQRLYPKVKFAQFASAGGIIGGLGFMILTPLTGKYLDLTGNVYSHTFYMSGALSLVALISFIVIWQKMKNYGGHKGYQPPE